MFSHFLEVIFNVLECMSVCPCSPSTGVGGVAASWLVHLSPDRAVRVGALAGDIVLCSWARYFTLTVPLSTQVSTQVYRRI